MEIFRDPKYLLMQKSLDALWLRQRVVANNIANIDTPGYKSKQVRFEDLLQRQIFFDSDIRDADLEPQITETKNLSVREDGNNVDIDFENLEMVRTQIQYEYMIRKLSDEFSKLRYVISEGRR